MKMTFSNIAPVVKKHRNRLLVLPWLVYAVYLVLIASPQYESQSQLVIKSTDGTSSFDPSSLMLASVAGKASADESQLVEAYILSADMLSYLQQSLALREHYQSEASDWFSGLSSNASNEEFLAYYLNHTEVIVDTASSVIQLKTRAFTEEYAQQINRAIVEKAEDFINQINNNLAKSKLTFAKSEHQIVEDKLQDAKTELLAFQARYNVLDPTASGAAFQQITFSLEATLAQKKAELNTLRKMMTEAAPDIVNIRREIEALQEQIGEQKEKISEIDDNGSKLSVSELIAQYSNLQVQLELAIQAFSASLITLENARVETYQKLQHLVTIESPTLPDENQYPRVIYNLTLFGVILIVLYGIVRIVVATIREL